MGYGVFVFMILGIILIIISVLIYFLFKSLGKRKFGIFLSLFIALIVLIPLFFLSFESFFYFKSDVVDDLQNVEFYLQDDFKIIDNKIEGLPEYYQTTLVEISEHDRDIIIDKIKSSNSFFKSNKSNLLMYYSNLKPEKIIKNYKFNKDYYIREYYKKETGYVSVYTVIIVNKNSNIIELKRIED